MKHTRQCRSVVSLVSARPRPGIPRRWIVAVGIGVWITICRVLLNRRICECRLLLVRDVGGRCVMLVISRNGIRGSRSCWFERIRLVWIDRLLFCVLLCRGFGVVKRREIVFGIFFLCLALPMSWSILSGCRRLVLFIPPIPFSVLVSGALWLVWSGIGCSRLALGCLR